MSETNETTEKKFLGLDGLNKLVENIKTSFSSIDHTHEADDALSETSTNPVQNKVIKTEFQAVSDRIDEVEANAFSGSWNDLVDKPFGEIEEETELLPETVVTLTEGEGGAMAIPGFSFTPEEGKDYIVYWQGSPYRTTCVNVDVDNQVSYLTLGNLSLMNMGEDTGEPFLYAYIPTYGIDNIAALSEAGDYTVRITEIVADTKTIDPKYLPEIQSGMLVVITEDDTTTSGYAANKTYQEILNAVVAGENVYALVSFYNPAMILSPVASTEILQYLSGISTFAGIGTGIWFRGLDKETTVEVLIYNDDDVFFNLYEDYALKSDFQSLESSLADGNVTVAKAAHATSADSATTAITAEASTKTVQDASGNVITETYETKTDASAKLTEAKSYADTQIAALVNAAPETLDTLGELAAAFQENEEVVDALDAAITTKADKSDVAIADWSVNDSSSPAYIANRTHWTDDPVESIIVEEQELSFADANFASIPLVDGFNDGSSYTITWDSVQYELVMENGQLGAPFDSVFGEYDFSSIPFSISVSDQIYFTIAASGTSHTVSISGITSEIHKIDVKYLPDGASIGAAGAGVGAEIFNDYEANHANGMHSHAEGHNNSANGVCSHVEGFTNVAEGDCSHAEGWSCNSDGTCSHAEGNLSSANADYSHAEGVGTTASSESQHVQGKWNVEDSEDVYAHIVGNGSVDAHSNAHTLDWDGNAWYAGTVKVGGTSYSDASEVALKSDFESIVAITNEEIDAIFASI